MKSKIILSGCLALMLALFSCEDNEDKIDRITLESITITPSSVSLTAGHTQQLTATTDPSGIDVVLEWSSENPTIASVSGEGLVTAKKEGNTKVTVKGGGTESSVQVSVSAVVIPLEDITVGPEELVLRFDATEMITATLVPENATNISLVFESSDESIATVNEAGQVTGTGVGSTTIKVKGGSIEKVIPVTVTIKDITVTPAPVLLEKGTTQQLEAEPVPAGTPGITFEYASGDESIATVSEDGLVTAVDFGTVTITVSAGEVTKEISVMVTGDPDNPERNLWKSGGASTVWQPGYEVEKAFDGDVNTYWHSDAGGSMPQWFIVDMSGVKNIDGFTYKSRQETNQTAIPKNIKIEISLDNDNWTTVLEQELPNFRGFQVFPLDARVTARYFKVTVTSNWAGVGYTYVAEIDIYSGDAPTPDPLPEPEPDTWWTVEASSSLDGMTANGLIDGDVSSTWHSNVGDGQPWAIIDFKESKTLYEIYFTGRQGGPTDIQSSPKHIIFWVSDDKQNWDKLIEVEELSNSRDMQVLTAHAAKTGRYLKIDIQSTWSDDPYSYIGEIGINDIGFNLTSYPLTLSGATNKLTVEEKGDYVILKPAGEIDPYVYTNALTSGLGAATAYIRMEYKSSVAITNAEWFFMSSPHFQTGENLKFDKTENWRVWQMSFEVKNGFGNGNALRFDLPNFHTADFYVRNLEIVVSN